MYSDKLRHFTERDPAPMTIKSRLQAEIEQQREQYLASGGAIYHCQQNESGLNDQPIRHNRKTLTEYIKRRDFMRTFGLQPTV